MSDGLLPKRKIPSPSARKWLVGLWALSMVLGMTAWWAGLAWVAVWLAGAVS